MYKYEEIILERVSFTCFFFSYTIYTFLFDIFSAWWMDFSPLGGSKQLVLCSLCLKPKQKHLHLCKRTRIICDNIRSWRYSCYITSVRTSYGVSCEYECRIMPVRRRFLHNPDAHVISRRQKCKVLSCSIVQQAPLHLSAAVQRVVAELYVSALIIPPTYRCTSEPMIDAQNLAAPSTLSGISACRRLK